MIKNNKWTDRENKYLKKWYGKKRYSEIGRHLERNTQAVVHQAIRLGLREHQRKMWTKQEELFLKKNFSKMTIKQISKHLDRTESSVAHKAHIDLKLKKVKTRKWTQAEKKLLKRHYGKISVAEIAALLNRKVSTVYSYAKIQNIISKRTVGYSEKEIKFMNSNYLKMTNEQIAKKLDCSVFRVQTMAKKFGLVGNPEKRKNVRNITRGPIYSEKEKNFIRKNYLKMTNKQIGLKLNRSQLSISGMMHKLGLTRSP